MKRVKTENKPAKKEAKGLFVIAFSLACFISLISFTYLDPNSCYLGIVGYYLAFLFTYLFGIGSYLVATYLFWAGCKTLSYSNSYRLSTFMLFLSCTCLLLNVFAEVFPDKLLSIEKKIVSEIFVLYSPFPKTFIRYNLGGVPFYYLFADLPVVSLQRLLSNIGTTIVFSMTGLASFLLLIKFPIITNLQKSFYRLKKGLIFLTVFSYKQVKKTFLFLKRLFLSIKISKREKPLDLSFPKPDLKIIKKVLKPIAKEIKKPIKLSESAPIIEQAFPDRSSYKKPPIKNLTNPKKSDHPGLKKDLRRQKEILEQTLLSFGIEAIVGQIHCGPTITSFEVHPPTGVKVQKIKALQNDLALNLEAKSIRIIAPIPGKAAVGVEVPSTYPQEVSFKELLYEYQKHKKRFSIPVFLGKTVRGDSVITDLSKMPHCLIAGATGSGKSVCINTIVMSILMTCSPEEVKLIMIDPKKVELTQYSNLPHMIAPVVTEANGAYMALQWLVKEMQTRYDILKQLGLRNITAFNKRKINPELESTLSQSIPEKMHMIVAIIDEFADLMMVSSSDLETPIARIAQMARAVGIHLVLATQRPSREVITGIIKANFPCRIAFKVASRINSQIILDETGAESLLGNGDLLFLPPGSSQLVRAQGAFIRDEDINQTLESICANNFPNYLVPSFDAMHSLDGSSKENAEPKDALYDQALSIVLETKNASTTFLQRKLKIGYARAASLMDALEENRVIGPPEGSKPRRIYALESKKELNNNS